MILGNSIVVVRDIYGPVLLYVCTIIVAVSVHGSSSGEVVCSGCNRTQRHSRAVLGAVGRKLKISDD